MSLNFFKSIDQKHVHVFEVIKIIQSVHSIT